MANGRIFYITGSPAFSSDSPFAVLSLKVPSAKSHSLVVANLATGALLEVATCDGAIYASWVPGSHRLVYAIPSGLKAGIWVADAK